MYSLDDICFFWLNSYNSYDTQIIKYICKWFINKFIYDYNQMSNLLIQHKKGKIKLIKDLKQGPTHLRQSLLDKNQIENLGKIFETKKQQYKIEEQKIEVSFNSINDNPQENQIVFLTPEERLEIYKRETMNKRLKQKLKHIFQPEVHQKTKMKQPKIKKMLQQFQNKYKNDLQPKYLLQLKQSQTNLENVKINSRRKAVYTANNTQYSSQKKRLSRISLQTSLPEDPKQYYPSIHQILQNRFVDTQKKKYTFNMSKFENALNVILKDKNTKKRQDSYINYNSTKDNVKKPNQKNSTLRSFNKVEKSSKSIIETMGKYYQTKQQKNMKYNQMVQILKHDRPLSTHLRRKNYKIIGQQLNEVRIYRNKSQLQRNQILNKNHEFYMTLIGILQQCGLEMNIHSSIQICEKLKQLFEFQYQLTQEHIESILDMKEDQKTEEIKLLVKKFIQQNNAGIQ